MNQKDVTVVRTLGELASWVKSRRAHVRIRFLEKSYRIDSGKDRGYRNGRRDKVRCTVFNEDLGAALGEMVDIMNKQLGMEPDDG